MEERAYTIPLRPVYNRAKRAVRAKRAMKHIREFIARHMKTDEENVKIHISVNHIVWQRGIQKPPRKIKVVAVKDGETVWVFTPEERAKMVKAAAKKKRTTKKKATSKAATAKNETKPAKEGEKKKTSKSTAKKKAEEERKETKRAVKKTETKEKPAESKSEEQ